ncbi:MULTISPECIES: CopG family transcriptional regulator [unclassified Crossiella]|uniref:CopG family transcriptional regulator n=1 Tax=unclassified Crossiella TaxID=2620835 RepID=UPI001FFE6504|nr:MULTISPECIES: CopG family transcriptional regulator [unclassified Crossiella]MCK2243376.1 CopG family transcriptional regulator [Crossiella sp. S99.2]MCK2254155.1 CopG family transcriptional regulator [Crossiella sp. S99.1]
MTKLSTKTAISVPRETFLQVEVYANRLGVTRSEFFTRAARLYLDQLDNESLTNQINGSLRLIQGEDEATGAAVAAGRRHLAGTDDEW